MCLSKKNCIVCNVNIIQYCISFAWTPLCVAVEKLDSVSRTVCSNPSWVGIATFTILLLKATTTRERASSIVYPI